MSEFAESKPTIEIEETATFKANCSDSCPCPAYLCDGHCPCPVPPPGALSGNIMNLEEVKKVDDIALINTFENDMTILFNNARVNHIDYFVAGVFIANHFPSVGWVLLSYLFSIPSISLLQQQDLFKKFVNQNLMYLSLLLGICGGSQMYAMYCLFNAFPFLLRK